MKQNNYVWTKQGDSCIYHDAFGIIKGRIDCVGGLGEGCWYWWQTKFRTDYELRVDVAKKRVEHALAAQSLPALKLSHK